MTLQRIVRNWGLEGSFIQLCLTVSFSVLSISCHFSVCCSLIISDAMPITFCITAISQIVQSFPVCLSDRIMFLVTFTAPLIFQPYFLYFEVNCRNKIYLDEFMKHIREELNFSFESERLNDIGSCDHVA